MDYREIGLRIQMAREDTGFTQTELADLLGLSQSTLSNYENGKRQFYLTQLRRIADRLGKPLDYFLFPITAEATVEKKEWANEKSEMDALVEIINILQELPAIRRRHAYDYIRWLQARQGKMMP